MVSSAPERPGATGAALSCPCGRVGGVGTAGGWPAAGCCSGWAACGAGAAGSAGNRVGVCSEVVTGGAGAGALCSGTVEGCCWAVAAGCWPTVSLVAVVPAAGVLFAPPELRTTAGGLVLPGAVSDTEVSDPKLVDACGPVVVEGCPAEVEVVDVCAPPVLLTAVGGLVLAGAEAVPDVDEALVLRWLDDVDGVEGDAVSAGAVDSDSEVADAESVSVGSAHAIPGVRAIAAPIPSAAASSPTRPMWPAYCSAQ